MHVIYLAKADNTHYDLIIPHIRKTEFNNWFITHVKTKTKVAMHEKCNFSYLFRISLCFSYKKNTAGRKNLSSQAGPTHNSATC